jgi:hypothetical protein
MLELAISKAYDFGEESAATSNALIGTLWGVARWQDIIKIQHNKPISICHHWPFPKEKVQFSPSLTLGTLGQHIQKRGV